MDEMMCGKRGRRELAVLGEKSKIFSSMRNWLIRTTKSGAVDGHVDDWDFEEGPHCGFRGPKAGCTACVAVIRDNHLLVANAGDSRCVLSRKGQAHDLTKDHKPDLEVEKYRILQAGGFIQCGRVNGSLNLTRAIGDTEFKENKHLPAEKQMVTADPELTSVELCNDDEFLVIACDGIWDCMSSQHLVDFIHEHLKTESDLKVVCEKVLDWCLAPAAGGLGCDNMTMILIQFKRPSTSSGSIISQQAPVV